LSHYHNIPRTPRIRSHDQDLQITIQRTVERDLELALPPPCELPKHSLAPPHVGVRGATVVLKDARHASSSGSSAADSSSSSTLEGSNIGVVSPP
jgi:hypothetical protein